MHREWTFYSHNILRVCKSTVFIRSKRSFWRNSRYLAPLTPLKTSSLCDEGTDHLVLKNSTPDIQWPTILMISCIHPMRVCSSTVMHVLSINRPVVLKHCFSNKIVRIMCQSYINQFVYCFPKIYSILKITSKKFLMQLKIVGWKLVFYQLWVFFVTLGHLWNKIQVSKHKNCNILHC